MKLNQLTGIVALLMCASAAVIAADAHHDHPPAAKPAADSHAAAAKDAPAKEAATKEAATKETATKETATKEAAAKEAPAKEAAAKEATTKDAVASEDQPKPVMKKARKQARAKPSHKAPTHGTPDAHGHADSAAPAAHGSHKAVAQDGHASPTEGHASKRVRVKDRSAAAVPASQAANDGAHASHAPDASHAAPAAKPAHDDHAAPPAKATSAEHKDHHDAHAAHATPAAKDAHPAKDAPAAKDTHAAHAAAHHDAHASPPDSHGHAVADKSSHAAASADYCNPPLKSEVAALFDRWNASLRTGDPKKVAANYAPGSVLLPTVSNRARFTAAEKEEYFAHFLARRPEGTIDDRVIDVDCNSATDAGLYTFRFSDGTSVKARYSFSYRRIGSQWLITSHHSSGMPESAEAASDHPVGVKQAKPAEKSADKSDQGSPAKGWVRYP